jgi:hypothetical protein
VYIYGFNTAAVLLPQVTLSLQNMDIVVQPPLSDAKKQLERLKRSLVESSKPFVRWMDGSCIETPEQAVPGDDDEPYVFSFLQDMEANPEVSGCQAGQSCLAMSRWLLGWLPAWC